jgi:hypothetical protein
MNESLAADDGWSWPDTLDACIAAPQSHRVLFQNEVARVLERCIRA